MKLLALILLLAGCVTAPIEAPKEESKVEPTPTYSGDFKVASPKFIWTKELVEAIETYGQDMLAANPKDMADYCPNYSSLDKKGKIQMWVMLFSKLAQYESNYNPKTSFYEKNVDDNPTSRGLFQMSIASGNGNYKCGIKKEMDLHDPKTNIECLIKAANILVPEGNKFNSPAKKARPASYVGGTKIGKYWQGLSGYWSPFRRGAQRAEIQKAARSVCK